ncbi:putative Bacteriophage CI repressor helix-turn-helix domain protein [Desulfamplus magnetovallimortis]|uniref:Putative Bacteriophage CI repressor helix-turn-helix domain protein n=1 Tax=Desulfamplus magnetovallimortis TaxID=1246637 RepID=A0A1W1H5W0_9BACT|nr:helix-turn-helix domain-containing protein [Desulfamplus magnetovallimortis]SLM27837.1 putative Bacteriophage CI repressor helix-turn-helix domain protein [Desulfamplus magnetovallimortis]
MSIENSLDANKIIQRLKQVVNVKTNFELAEILEIKPNTISSWKKRGNLDLNKIISLCEYYKVSVDWLLYGKTEQCISSTTERQDPTDKILQMLETMTEEQKRDVLKYVEKEKLFEEFIKTRKIA